jgi:DNA-binding YbaB/EbfC family protein
MKGGIGNMMKQAQKMQAKMMKIQEGLAHKTVEATAGGGMVSVIVNGKNELVEITIEKEVVNPEDIEMLQDLVLAAVNEGLRKSQDMAQQEMSQVTSGLNLPGMGGLL